MAKKKKYFPKCPYCDEVENLIKTKEWDYGLTVKVSRFKCKCGKLFNYYRSPKRGWTVPKKKKSS